MNNSQPNTSRLNSQTLTNKPSLNDKLLASNKQQTQTNKSNSTTPSQAISQPTSNSSTNNFQGKSFAETTANSYTPKMEQAIVMNSVDGIKQIQYIIALNKITDASNIISASRISNNRFCVFLKSQQIANDIINKHSAIYIDSIEIPIRKLINPSKRIILSNVYPAIPNNIIIEALVNLDIKITSPITALKAGFQLDQFAHITSFRRQLYISPEDFSKLPGSIAITSDNTTYRIFITDDTVTCFLCKRTGHVSSSCKTSYTSSILPENTGTSNKLTATDNITHHTTVKPLDINEKPNESQTTCTNSFLPENMDTLNDDSTILSTYHSTSEITPITKETLNQDNDTTMLNINYTNISEPQDHQVIKKRPAPESTCPSSPLSPLSSSFNMETHDIPQEKNKSTKEKKIIKKTKIRSRSPSSTRSNADKIDEQLELASEIFLKNEVSSINKDSLKYILENFSNKNINIHDLCNQVGSNATNIQNLIEQIRPLLTDRSIKTKITKLSNLLFQSIPPFEN